MLKTWAAGPKDALPLVFIHGWACSHAAMQPLIELLKDEFYCQSIDLLGHGESPDARDYSIAAQAGAVIETCGATLRRSLIIGHSMGGQIALDLAARGYAAAAVLLDPANIISPSGAVKWNEAHRETLKTADIPAHLEQFARNQFRYKIAPEIVESVAKTMAKTQPEVARKAWDAILSFDGVARLTALDRPTLTIFADRPLNDGR
ncbi:MAG: alpha/beta hydrolase, partial [Pseudomonadota bacterium]